MLLFSKDFQVGLLSPARGEKVRKTRASAKEAAFNPFRKTQLGGKATIAEQIQVDKPVDRIVPAPGRHADEPKDPAAQPQEASPDAPTEPPVTPPLALRRAHPRLSEPEVLRELHLQRRHMSGEQCKFQSRNIW